MVLKAWESMMRAASGEGLLTASSYGRRQEGKRTYMRETEGKSLNSSLYQESPPVVTNSLL
jgi:hypothetical protein